MGALDSDVPFLRQVGQYVIGSGGKRMRPRVLLLACLALNGATGDDVVRAASALELLHVASLVHDDINDQSDMRRGRPSVNGQWGDGLALLVGDFVFVRLLKMITGLDGRVVDVFADCCTAVVEGETVQMMTLGDTALSEEHYLQVVSNKTASLFAASAEMGALLALAERHSEGLVSALRRYGLNLGIAFQIRDDTLDLVGRCQDMGKPTAMDLVQGKMSLATIKACRESQAARELLAHKPSPDSERVLTVLRDTGGIDYAVARGIAYAQSAEAALDSVPESAARQELVELARYAARRER